MPCDESGATFSKGDGGTVTRDNEYFNVLPSSQATTMELSVDIQLDCGDSLVFRADTDLAINPSALQWAPVAQVSELCLPGDGGCGQPTDDELKRFSFAATTHLEEHRQATCVPLRSLVVPQDGTLVLKSSNHDLSPFPAATFSARTPAQLIFKHGVNESAGLDGGLQIPVTAGQRILFEAHSDTPRAYDWKLSATLVLPDGGPRPDAGSDAGAGIALNVPMNSSYDRYIELGDGGLPSNFRTVPMGGGHHGWRYGVWHGGADGGEAFDPSLLYARGAAISIPEGSSEEQLTALKGQFRNPDNRLVRASRLFSPLVPSRNGTRQGLATAGGSAGLLPDVSAFISQDCTVFITDSAMHASESGTDVNTGRSLRTLFALGNAHRASTGWTFSGGLGLKLGLPAGALDTSFDLGFGSSSQVADVRDMNGDGIVDVVSKDHGVLLSPLAGQGGSAHQFGAGLQLSESSELSGSVGLGYGIPIKTETLFGKTIGFEVLYPSTGIGVGMNFSSKKVELVDINGDGLPDQVRFGQAPGMMLVRLNLGTSFAANEDAFPIPNIAAPPSPDGGTLVHSISEELKLKAQDPPDDPDLEGAIDGGIEIAATLESPDALEKSTAVTLTQNTGIQFDEMFGVSANIESSLSQTEASLVDVTGDGLPDYVQKTTGEKSFRVRINSGYGFGPEIEWKAPAFPAGSLPGFGLPYDARAQGVYDLLDWIGLNKGSDEVAASGVLAGASVGFVASAPPFPIFGVSLLISGGENVSRKYSGFEMGFVDIDGDGLADQVLRRQQLNPITNTSTSLPVYARLNQEKDGNLLLHVDEPLGESFDLGYERLGNTTDMPQSRHVLATVDVHDGVGQGVGHDLHSQYHYENGFYDREEREFFGFGTVTITRPYGAREIAEYHNRDYAHRGLVSKQTLVDADGNLFTVSTNHYGPPDHVTGPLAATGSQTAQQQDCVANTPFFLDPQAYCTSVFVPLQSTEASQYEGQAKAADGITPITTRQELTYDGFGNVLTFVDQGDTAVTNDEINAAITYADDTAASALYSVSRPKHVTVQQGNVAGSGAVLREREATDDGRGNLKTFGAHVDSSRVATSTLTWRPDGMLESFTGPPADKGPGYSVTYSYDNDVTGSWT